MHTHQDANILNLYEHKVFPLTIMAGQPHTNLNYSLPLPLANQSKGPFTHFMALCAITHFHTSAAGIMQRYHLCRRHERDAHTMAHNGTRVQLS